LRKVNLTLSSHYHDLAKINGIEKPYYIHAGQVLLISKYEELTPKTKTVSKQKFEYQAQNAPVVSIHKTPQKATLHSPLPMATSPTWIWPVRQGYIAKSYSIRNKGIDIGVNTDTAPKLVEAGATKLVSGSAIYNSPDIKAAIQELSLA